jgi:hypothetical protein
MTMSFVKLRRIGYIYFGKNLSIDESMIKFKGMSSMKQNIPTKPFQEAIK